MRTYKGVLGARGLLASVQSLCQYGANQRPSKFVFSLGVVRMGLLLIFAHCFLGNTLGVPQMGVNPVFMFVFISVLFYPMQGSMAPLSLRLSPQPISRLKQAKISTFRSTDKMLSWRKGLVWLLGDWRPGKQAHPSESRIPSHFISLCTGGNAKQGWAYKHTLQCQLLSSDYSRGGSTSQQVLIRYEDAQKSETNLTAGAFSQTACAGWVLSDLFCSSLASQGMCLAVVYTGRKMMVEQMPSHQMKPYLGPEHQYRGDRILTMLTDIKHMSLPEGHRPSSHIARHFAPGKEVVLGFPILDNWNVWGACFSPWSYAVESPLPLDTVCFLCELHVFFSPSHL